MTDAPIAFVFGLLVGSFLNVVVYRLPRGESVAWPGSRCTQCKEAIAWYDNIPLLSYLWLLGRCRHCKVGISPRYPALEFVVGLLFAGMVLRYGIVPMTILWLGFAAALVAAAAIDFEHQIIPDEISLGGLALGLTVVPLAAVFDGAPWRLALAHSFLGALIGGGMLWIVGFVHARMSAASGRKFEHWPEPGEDYPRFASLDYWTWFPGMGFGDVKLLAMIGAFVGPLGVVEVVLVACGIGLLFGLASAIWTRSWHSPFGFGPALAGGALFVALAPPALHFLG